MVGRLERWKIEPVVASFDVDDEVSFNRETEADPLVVVTDSDVEAEVFVLLVFGALVEGVELDDDVAPPTDDTVLRSGKFDRPCAAH